MNEAIAMFLIWYTRCSDLNRLCGRLHCFVRLGGRGVPYTAESQGSMSRFPGRVRKLGFQQTSVFTAFGISVKICSERADLIPLLLQRLPPGSRLSSQKPQRIYTIRIVTQTNPPQSSRCDESDISVQIVTARSTNLALVASCFFGRLVRQPRSKP